MSFGEDRVRINPGDPAAVKRFKGRAIELFDIMDALQRNNANGEIRRHVALALTAFEEGLMWGTKAMTTKGAFVPEEPEEPEVEPEEEGDAEVRDAEEQEKAAV